MLANERFIIKMSLEQKVRFVTSLTAYESSSVGGYEFPVFKLKGQPYDDCPNVFATRFPSDKALAASWNSRLVSAVYRAIGNETRRVHSFGYFNSTDDAALEDLSCDDFLTAKFLLAKTLGLTRSHQAVNLEMTQKEAGAAGYKKKLIGDTVLAGAKPTSVLVKHADEIETISKKFKYDNAFFGTASSMEEAVRMLFSGCCLVFLSEDFTPELVNFLTDRTEGYRKAYKSYRGGSMSLEEFDRRVRRFEIFDEEIINAACDRLITILFEMKEGGENIPPMHGLDAKRPAKFDEISHDELALRAARESVVLLKNDGILPLTHRTSLAVAGEYAGNFSYQKELFGYNTTVRMLPFEAINNYDELTTTGYVAGYAKGEPGRADLVDSAVQLCSKSDCTLVYLCAGKGETSLPPEQIELIDALSLRGVPMIAVVACDEQIDLSFADKFKAVLLSYNGGQEGTAAVLDILSGIISPSGKLARPILGQSGEVMYPFGWGLSYTKFEYRALKGNAGGVSLTVANTGNADGFACVQLYVRKLAGDSFAEKTLRGFEKVFVAQGDAKNVVIPFDENTFKSYSEEKQCYIIEGGEYEITVAEYLGGDKVTGTVKLGGHVYKDVFENEIVESSEKEVVFTGDKEREDAAKARRKLSFGVKLFLALMLALYFDGVLAVFAFTPIIADKDVVLYSVLGGLAFVINLVLLIYVIRLANLRKKQRLLSANEVLTDMVGRVQPFKEIAKVTYLDPVEEKEDTDKAEDGTNAENGAPQTEPEEAAERRFDVDFDESEEEITFTEHISLAEICSNFREFALSYGVNIEITSVRALVSAMAASKLVILKAANSEVMPDFLEALSAYFGSPAPTETWPDWNNRNDLMWTLEGDRYVVSPFANAVHGAEKNPAKLCAAILTAVSFDNLTSYFGDFVAYANHPSEEHELTISEELTFKLPANMTYFLVPEDGAAANLQRELVNASMCVDLVLSRADRGAEVEVKNVARAEFLDLIKTSREEAFLPEKIWKKLDEFVETISATDKFAIGNKNTLQIERLTSVIMDCGGDEGEAFSAMFLCKLVPLLKTTRIYKQADGDRMLSGIIEKLFPDEDLSKIQRALTKLN